MTRSAILLTAILQISLMIPIAAAKEKPWHKYENDYFAAYSDASERKVRRLLEELENFRAAVIQISGTRVPDGAVKTQVVIFNSKRQFRETIDQEWVEAYAASVRGVPYIVMSVRGLSDRSRATIRHEFTHVVQAYDDHQFPPWYVEGFAEFMSGLTFGNKNTEIIVGDSPGRPMAGGSLINWNDLISDDFEFHQIDSRTQASNSYLQSWMLVHYLMLGDNLAHYQDFMKYLTLTNQGKSSTAAFAAVFGESAEEMGPRIYRLYSRGFQAKPLKFLPGYQDHNFVRTPAASDIHSNIVDQLRSVDWGEVE